MKYIIAAVLALVVGAIAVKVYARPTVAQFRPCVWPNTCNELTLPILIQNNAVAQIQPCVWPNRCATAL